jgi:hypothetical protein
MRRGRWAVEQRDAQRAIVFAEAARRITGTSEHIRALSAMRVAQGHALAHDTHACELSLATAHDLLGRTNPADAPDLRRVDGTSTWVMGDETRCWLWLRPRKAIPMVVNVLRRLPHERTRKRGVHQAHLAMACAAADEPERAAAEGMKALHIAEAIQSDVIARRLKEPRSPARRQQRTRVSGVSRGTRRPLSPMTLGDPDVPALGDGRLRRRRRRPGARRCR